MECQNIEVNEEVAKSTIYNEYLDLMVTNQEIAFFRNTPNKFTNLKFNFEEKELQISKPTTAKAEDVFFADFIFPSYFNFFFSLNDFYGALEFINSCQKEGKSVDKLLRAILRANHSFVTAFESSFININNQKTSIEEKIENAISSAFTVFPSEVIELVRLFQKENTEKFFRKELVEPTIALLKNQSPYLITELSRVKTDKIKIIINDQRNTIPFKESIDCLTNVISSDFDKKTLQKINEDREFVPTIFIQKPKKEIIGCSDKYQIVKEITRQKEAARKVRYYLMKELLQKKVWSDPNTAYDSLIDNLDRYAFNYPPELSNHIKNYEKDIAKAEYINFLNCFTPIKNEPMKVNEGIRTSKNANIEPFVPTLSLLNLIESNQSDIAKFGNISEAAYALGKDLIEAMNFNIKIPLNFNGFFRKTLVQKRLHAVLIYSLIISMKSSKYSDIIGNNEEYCKFMQTFFDVNIFDEKFKLTSYINGVLFKV